MYFCYKITQIINKECRNILSTQSYNNFQPKKKRKVISITFSTTTKTTDDQKLVLYLVIPPHFLILCV